METTRSAEISVRAGQRGHVRFYINIPFVRYNTIKFFYKFFWHLFFFPILHLLLQFSLLSSIFIISFFLFSSFSLFLSPSSSFFFFLSFSFFLFLSPSPSLSLPLSLSIYLSIYLSIFLYPYSYFSFIYLSFYLSIFLRESENMASQLAQGHRANRAVRCGSSTVLAVGLPSIRSDLTGSHSASYIYPLHFRSTRIYWSMSVPLTRTLYIFEVRIVLISYFYAISFYSPCFFLTISP